MKSSDSTTDRISCIDQLHKLEVQESSLISEDLATFLVAHYVIVTRDDSIESVKRYFRETPDVAGCIDYILSSLENIGLISIDGDRLFFHKRHIDLGSNTDELKKFLPRLFKVAVDRILLDSKDGVVRQKKEGLRYFVLPDSPEIATEAKNLYLEYKAKMLALVDKAERQNISGVGIRLVGSFNCALQAEDFV